MQQINVNELKPHPRNNEFFDDMSGEKWSEFLESIRTSGVIEPVVITTDMTIVSGHQRVRACKELGIASVITDMRDYSDEDKILKDLIETNIRQRGIGNPNPVKLGRCIKELERIYGIQHGATSFQGNQHSEVTPKISESPTQEQIADMIPELEDLADAGLIPFSLFIDDTESEYVFKEITEENCWIIKNLIDGRYFTASTEFMQEYELLED